MDWPAEKIADLDNDKLKSLRDNAAKRGATDIAERCDAEIAKRAPARRPSVLRKSRSNQVVGGFHFVCAKSRGVTPDAEGRVWTGTWVVDEEHAERAMRVEAYVALHEAKVERSYLQGIVRGWRKAQRDRQYADDRETRMTHGIDFLIEETKSPYDWHGDGAGEKGYYWIDPPNPFS